MLFKLWNESQWKPFSTAGSTPKFFQQAIKLSLKMFLITWCMMNLPKESMHFIFLMQWKCMIFLSIAEEEIVYEVPQESQVIDDLVEMFKNRSDEENVDNSDDADDSNEMPVIGIAAALQSLETMRMFSF